MGATSPDDIQPLDADDPVLADVEDLLKTWGGVLFTGPPGTSKSYYAERVARALAGDSSRVRLIQFHPSYQYEDFMQGYSPKQDGSGYELKARHFMEMCEAAKHDESHRYVIIIDELSRADPGRVFGEALTYIERTKRGKAFRLASGSQLTVPVNLDILATMNPLDRGVDEVDAALNRRFAKLAMDPDGSILESFLADAGMPPLARQAVTDFFEKVNADAMALPNPHAQLGHTYFLGVGSATALGRLWTYQLRFHFESAFRLDVSGFADIQAAWQTMMATVAAVEAENERA